MFGTFNEIDTVPAYEPAEMWDRFVGDQGAAEFMALSDSDDPEIAALDYVAEMARAVRGLNKSQIERIAGALARYIAEVL